MATTTLNLKVQPWTLNKPGTILIECSGPRAFNVPIEVLIEELNSNFGLSWDHVESLYNLEMPNRWYLTLKEEAKAEHYARLHYVNIGNLDTQGFVAVLIHEDKVDTKVLLHWVPTMLGEEGVMEIAQHLAAPNSRIRMSRHPYNASKWALYITLAREIPHYILVNAGIFKNHKIWVQVPGRRVQCFHCQSLEHWSNQCEQKKAPATRTTTASAPAKSYASATSGKRTPPPPPPPMEKPPMKHKPVEKETKLQAKKKEDMKEKKVEKKGLVKKAIETRTGPQENPVEEGFCLVTRRSRSTSPAKHSYKRQNSQIIEQAKSKHLKGDLNKSFTKQV